MRHGDVVEQLCQIGKCEDRPRELRRPEKVRRSSEISSAPISGRHLLLGRSGELLHSSPDNRATDVQRALRECGVNVSREEDLRLRRSLYRLRAEVLCDQPALLQLLRSCGNRFAKLSKAQHGRMVTRKQSAVSPR